MKKLIAIMLMMLPIFLVSCSKGDEVWGLRIGESRDNVAKQLKEKRLGGREFLRGLLFVR